MRIVEYCRNELRENHAPRQELTSQVQELQERMNYVNQSKEFQDFESICLENYLTFSVSLQSLQVLELCRAVTKACDLTYGIFLGQRETLLAIHVL